MNEKKPESDKPRPARSLLARLFSGAGRKQDEPAPMVAPATEPPRSGQSKKILILVVDDDPIILKTTSIKLKSHGYSVVTATEASQAVGIVRKEKPDLVLLDINFPPDVSNGATAAWDGFKIMAWLRRLDDCPNIPIIVISGGDAERNRDRSLAQGALDYFPKPIDHERLVQTIENALSKSPATGAVEAKN